MPISTDSSRPLGHRRPRGRSDHDGPEPGSGCHWLCSIAVLQVSCMLMSCRLCLASRSSTTSSWVTFSTTPGRLTIRRFLFTLSICGQVSPTLGKYYLFNSQTRQVSADTGYKIVVARVTVWETAAPPYFSLWVCFSLLAALISTHQCSCYALAYDVTHRVDTC